MLLLKRFFLVGIPLILVLIGAALSAQTPARPHKCGEAVGMAALLQKVGVHSAHERACDTASPDGVNEWCVNPGHHCSDSSGPGKCTTVMDELTSRQVCACMPNH